MKSKIQKFYIILLITSCWLLITTFAQAATLYFSPSSGEYATGNTLSVSVYVTSADQAINAASGAISFPSDKLEVMSLSKTSSIFSLWVQEPSFSNSAGTVNFEGIVLNPGFTGVGGKVITVNFRIKAAGVALLNFSSGSALANDGKGTNILANLGTSQFSFGGAAPTVPESTTPSAVSGAPSAPQISSATHSDPNKWYTKKDAEFVWRVPSNATEARLLIGKIPQAIPNVIYAPAISEKEVTNLDDGIWYFHVQLRNASGWGGVSHFRLQIDAEKPSRFDITEISQKDPAEPRAEFVFDAKDETSGVDHYEIQIDGGNAEVWTDDGSRRYKTIPLGPGKHTLIAKAVDVAGNSLASSAEFTIKALNSPNITEYPKELQSGETLVVRGSTYPNSKVNIWLQREKDDQKSFTVQSDKDGKFVFITDGQLRDGVYNLWAEVIDGRGARSLPTEKITILMTKLAIFRIGNWAVSFLAVVVPLIALIILLLIIILQGWYRFIFLRKQLQKEVREAESALHKVFDLLKHDIREQVKMLEKTRTRRQLTEEEEKIIRQLKKDLDNAEKFVKREMNDIKRAAG